MRRRGEQDVVVEVVDRGRGFDRDQLDVIPAGLGLRNMRERAEEIGAEIDVRSSAGDGTRVIVCVPLLT